MGEAKRRKELGLPPKSHQALSVLWSALMSEGIRVQSRLDDKGVRIYRVNPLDIPSVERLLEGTSLEVDKEAVLTSPLMTDEGDWVDCCPSETPPNPPKPTVIHPGSETRN